MAKISGMQRERNTPLPITEVDFSSNGLTGKSAGLVVQFCRTQVQPHRPPAHRPSLLD